SPNPSSRRGVAGLILSALLAGNQPLTWQESSAETAYKELITHTVSVESSSAQLLKAELPHDW
ncbi:hypothetical protein, partial [Glaciibacter psychrotolerans]